MTLNKQKLTADDVLGFISENKDRPASFELTVEFTKFLESDLPGKIGVLTGKEVKAMNEGEWRRKLELSQNNQSKVLSDMVNQCIGGEDPNGVIDFVMKIGAGVYDGFLVPMKDDRELNLVTREGIKDDARLMVVVDD